MAVELADGRLILNMRGAGEPRCRRVCFSSDGGRTWANQQADRTLIEPPCQASLVRYRWEGDGGKNTLLFSNPANDQRDQRDKLTVRLSYDDGRTWPGARLLHGGPSAYSSLAALPDGEFACLYEAGQKYPLREDYLRPAYAGLADGQELSEAEFHPIAIWRLTTRHGSRWSVSLPGDWRANQAGASCSRLDSLEVSEPFLCSSFPHLKRCGTPACLLYYPDRWPAENASLSA